MTKREIRERLTEWRRRISCRGGETYFPAYWRYGREAGEARTSAPGTGPSAVLRVLGERAASYYGGSYDDCRTQQELAEAIYQYRCKLRRMAAEKAGAE